MTASHHHAAPRRPFAAAPTLSLLRLSAAARMVGAGLVAALVWAMVLAVVAS